MKNIRFLFILAGLFFTSCNENIQVEKDLSGSLSIEQKIKAIPENHLKIVTIENCEYFILKEKHDSNSEYGFMSHKGNCKNPDRLIKTID